MRNARAAVPFLAFLLAGCTSGGIVFEWKPQGSEEDSDEGLRKAARREERALDLAAGETLTLEGRCGDVSIEASPDGAAHLVADVSAWGRTSEEARERLDRVRISSERLAEGTRVFSEPLPPLERKEGRAYHVRERIDYQVRLPAGGRVKIDAGAGSVSLTGPLGGARARTSFGDVQCTGLRGDLAAESSSGSVTVRDVEGMSIAAETDYGRIDLASVKADRVMAKTGSGRIAAEGVAAGRLEIESAFGACRLREVSGTVSVVLSSGDLSAKGVSGKLEARSSFGDLSAEGAFDALSLRGDSGTVRASSTTAPTAPWSLTTSHGSVEIALPADAAFVLDARTAFGRIETEFPVAVGETAAGRVSGTVGAGGPRIELRTAGGDIRLSARKK